ncbi:transposase family protein, partial [Streptococcus agalactiae]|uniref:transposase family protein n=10 Tax=Streptococcus agalactiae TaxID=1311 RepID=UPI000A5F840C
MVKKLEYPIDRIHQNLALRKDKVVVAYYRIPNTPITITDSDKKDSHKTKVAQVIKKLAKYKNFDISLIDFLRNKIWYNSSMNYEASKQLTDVRFKRLVGVQRTTFEEMLAVLKTAYQRKHAKGGRTPKLSLEDLLMATLQYMREYRTYEQIAADFGIHESNLIRRSQWVESTLIQSGFTISKTHLSAEDTVIVDATEVKINRPKK